MVRLNVMDVSPGVDLLLIAVRRKYGAVADPDEHSASHASAPAGSSRLALPVAGGYAHAVVVRGLPSAVRLAITTIPPLPITSSRDPTAGARSQVVLTWLTAAVTAGHRSGGPPHVVP